MEGVIQTIEQVTRSEEWNRAFFNPNLEVSRPVMQVNEVTYGKTTQQYGSDHPNNNQPHQNSFTIVSEETVSSQGVHLGKGQDSQPTNMVPRKYYATILRGST